MRSTSTLDRRDDRAIFELNFVPDDERRRYRAGSTCRRLLSKDKLALLKSGHCRLADIVDPMTPSPTRYYGPDLRGPHGLLRSRPDASTADTGSRCDALQTKRDGGQRIATTPPAERMKQMRERRRTERERLIRAGIAAVSMIMLARYAWQNVPLIL